MSYIGIMLCGKQLSWKPIQYQNWICEHSTSIQCTISHHRIELDIEDRWRWLKVPFWERVTTFWSFVLGQLAHRPLLLLHVGCVSGSVGAASTPRSATALATKGRPAIIRFWARRRLCSSTRLSPTSNKKNLRFARRVDPLWFFHSGCINEKATKLLTPAVSSKK